MLLGLLVSLRRVRPKRPLADRESTEEIGLALGLGCRQVKRFDLTLRQLDYYDPEGVLLGDRPSLVGEAVGTYQVLAFYGYAQASRVWLVRCRCDRFLVIRTGRMVVQSGCLFCRDEFAELELWDCGSCGDEFEAIKRVAHQRAAQRGTILCDPCRGKADAVRNLARHNRYRTATFGRVCVSCERPDSETRWSSMRDLCAACERRRSRNGSCSDCRTSLRKQRGREPGSYVFWCGTCRAEAEVEA